MCLSARSLHFLNISRDGDSAISLCSPCQCSTTLLQCAELLPLPALAHWGIREVAPQPYSTAGQAPVPWVRPLARWAWSLLQVLHGLQNTVSKFVQGWQKDPFSAEGWGKEPLHLRASDRSISFCPCPSVVLERQDPLLGSCVHLGCLPETISYLQPLPYVNTANSLKAMQALLHTASSSVRFKQLLISPLRIYLQALRW